ncbi:MAG: AMP-binding protein, partial [Planctomycetes bacterium]|nr:AMP-binding protein [Planctomycetota bacterium]
VDDGEIGEIAVSGPVVTKQYFNLPEATAATKIADGQRIWHRIGDAGYRDDQGRVWFCGRKAHRVLTETGPMFTIPCEAIFNEHPDVARSALVGVGQRGSQMPVIVAEPNAGRFPSNRRADRFREELLALARANPLTKDINCILFHRSLPVDVRHNVKINREELARWAQRRLR